MRIKPMTFQTANKVTEACEQVDYRIVDLNITVTAWVVGDSPPLLSLGKLIEDHKASYTWKSGSGPVLSINGRAINCQVWQRCPFVATSLSIPNAAPGVEIPKMQRLKPKSNMTSLDSKPVQKSKARLISPENRSAENGFRAKKQGQQQKKENIL